MNTVTELQPMAATDFGVELERGLDVGDQRAPDLVVEVDSPGSLRQIRRAHPEVASAHLI